MLDNVCPARLSRHSDAGLDESAIQETTEKNINARTKTIAVIVYAIQLVQETFGFLNRWLEYNSASSFVIINLS